MSIILKHTFKNIFHKPARTFLLTLCIFLCTVTATMCLDMSGSVERLLANQFSSVLGSSDIDYTAFSAIDEKVFGELPENRYLLISAEMTPFYRNDPVMYSYAVETPVYIYGMNLKKAYDMKILLTELNLNENETAMTKDLAELLGYKEGDRIFFYDHFGEKVEFTVAALIERGGLINSRDRCVISPEGMDRITGGETEYTEAFVDIINDRKTTEAEKILKELDPEADIFSLTGNDEIKDVINQLSSLFYTLFAVCVLVVVIMTVTVSKRIMSERMSVTGTLRSLGASQNRTAFILMLENVIYALSGSIPGLIVYSIIRTPILDGLFTAEENALDFGVMPASLWICVIAGAIVLECLCTASEIFSASRTAIRDIIFLNKDTEYRHSKLKTAAGLVLLPLSVVLYFVKGNFFPPILCFLSAVVSVFFLFPYVSRACAALFEKLFAKLNMPSARLGAAEAATKKSTVASSSLIVAAAAVSMLLFTMADSIFAIFSADNFAEADIVVKNPSMEDYYYDYIDNLDGVTAVENVYNYEFMPVEVNGIRNQSVSIISCEKDGMFSGVKGLPDEIADGECYMDRTYAESLNLSVGDSADFIIDYMSFLPYTTTMKLAGYIDSVYFNQSGKSIVVNRNTYILCDSDTPKYILVKTEEGRRDEVLDRINKYSASTCEEAVFSDKMYRQEQDENRSETVMIKVIGFAGIILTFVGVASNQLIGFESRKRETAVLLSVAMSRSKLRRMLLAETFTASVVPLIFSVPLGIILNLPIIKIMKYIGTEVHLTVNLPELLILAVALLAVFLMTVLFPYGTLRKMKIAEQLKYE